MRLLHDFCDTELTPTSYVLAKELLFKKDPEERDEEVVRDAHSKLLGHLEQLDDELPSGLANWIERLRSRPSVRRQTRQQDG